MKTFTTMTQVTRLEKAKHSTSTLLPKNIIIASSSSGLLPTRIQSLCNYPERVCIGHPFNPVYLLPLVELVSGKQTKKNTITRAKKFYEEIGMKPLIVKKEIEGYISDRLQEALWREALHIIKDGIASVSYTHLTLPTT